MQNFVERRDAAPRFKRRFFGIFSFFHGKKEGLPSLLLSLSEYPNQKNGYIMRNITNIYKELSTLSTVFSTSFTHCAPMVFHFSTKFCTASIEVSPFGNRRNIVNIKSFLCISPGDAGSSPLPCKNRPGSSPADLHGGVCIQAHIRPAPRQIFIVALSANHCGVVAAQGQRG